MGVAAGSRSLAGLTAQPALADLGSAPFDPAFSLADLSRRALATLGREWMLHGHLMDRAGIPLYMSEPGVAAGDMEQLAIDEWMAASPIYSLRMQEALRFGGHDVPTIFKNLQLDIGAPHQFLDFRFRVDGPDRGEFWLAHCGALMDVEPMGEEFVVGMCHHIEDPTFDATAGVTNPHAQVRPIHRPPRSPDGRHPNCHWTVRIVPEDPPAAVHPNLALMKESPLARLPVLTPAGEDGQGRPDYGGTFDPSFVLEDLSAPALVAALGEFAVQSHLLARAMLLALDQRLGYDRAIHIGHRALTGLAGITAERLARACGLAPERSGSAGSGAASDVARLLQVHPVFHPEHYLPTRVTVSGKRTVRLAIGRGPGTEEPDRYTWLACLDGHGPAPLEAIARAIAPGCRARVAEPARGESRAYEIEVPPDGEAGREPSEMALIRFSTGADFRFRFPFPIK